MKNEFVTYEQALALKELGFDEHCFGYYADKTGEDKTIYTVSQVQGSINSMSIHFNTGSASYQFSAPLYQQAFRWFREKHGLRIANYGSINYSGELSEYFEIFKYDYGTSNKAMSITVGAINYEEAEQACLDKLIEIVRNTKS